MTKPNHKCKKCKTNFLSRGNLKRHIDADICQQKNTNCKNEKTFKCDVCYKMFVSQSNLKKHQKSHFSGSLKKFSENLIVDDYYNDVIKALPSMALKYKAAQKMGIVVKDIFPLCFLSSESDLEIKERLKDIISFENSEDILINILNETQHLFLNKNLLFSHENMRHELKDFLMPPKTEFDLEDFGSYVKVTLKPIKRRLDALASELFQTKKQKKDEIFQANDANLVVNNDAVNQNLNQNIDQNMDQNIDEGQPPENHLDPPEGEPPGGQGGDPGDDDPDDPDGGGGGGGGGGPIPPNNNNDIEGNEEEVDELENYLLQIRDARDGQGRGRGRSMPYYSGQDLLHFPNLKHKDAYLALYQACSTIHQYISIPMFPKILTDRELQILTGHSRENFDFFLENLCPPQIRFRKLSPDAKAVLYLNKLKQGSAFDSQSMISNVSKEDCRTIFWEHALHQYYYDSIIPHRNIVPRFEIPQADQILHDNIVTDPYLLGIFEDLIQPGQSLVIWVLDHTYLYMPSISSIRGQKRTRSSHKKKNCIKYGVLSNYLGQPVRYTPISASICESNGDGNLTTLQIEYELNEEVFNTLDELMRPQNPQYVVVTVTDKGYVKHNCNGDRGTNHTLEKLFNDPTSAGYNPNSRLIYPLEAKNKLYDHDFKPIENPAQANRRGKLTCREANDTRLCTKIRWVIEAVFMHMRQFRQLDMRFIDTQFFDPCGKLLPENRDLPKLEIIFNNILSNQRRNNQPFARIWPLPTQMTWPQMGRNFEHRRMLRNEFDHFENVTWPSFKQFPREDSVIWDVVQYTDPIIQFPEISHEDFTMVTHGPYQMKNGDKYLTNITELKVIQNIQQDENITWQQYDILCATLPNDFKVAYTDVLQEPQNWNEQLFGVWFPRRLLFGKVPNRISGTKTDHKVIISFLPNSPEWEQPNHPNRLGFIQNGLKQIIGYACISDGCHAGHRLAGCCSHVATVLLAVGVYANNPDLFKSTYKKLHLIDVKNNKNLNKALFRHNIDEEIDEENDNVNDNQNDSESENEDENDNQEINFLNI